MSMEWKLHKIQKMKNLIAFEMDTMRRLSEYLEQSKLRR